MLVMGSVLESELVSAAAHRSTMKRASGWAILFPDYSPYSA